MTDKENPNIHVLTGGGVPDLGKEAVRNLAKNMEHLVAFVSLISKLQREKYKSLLEEGFSESQALELSKNPLP